MPELKPLHDMIGNVLSEGDFVAVSFEGVPIGRVVKLHSGGIHLAEGHATTPAMVRIIIDITISAAPGERVRTLARVPNPQQEYIMKKLIDEANKMPGNA